MRNPVAKNDYNRAATHPDRSKRPQLTVNEGLLDYYAENAQEVAQSVYDNREVGLFIDSGQMKPVTHDSGIVIKRQPLSEEDKKERVLRVEIVFTPKLGTELASLMDSLAKR